MEKKQLNFSAPLMSARRYSSPLHSSPENKRRDLSYEDQKPVPNRANPRMEHVVKPGSVPFLWEQIPGKAKGGDVSCVTSFVEVPSCPKLPPGKKSGELNGFRSYNKLSGEISVFRPYKLSGELQNLRNNNKNSGEINGFNKFSSLNDVMDQWGKEGSEMNASFESEDDDEDEEDVTFSDAIENLSQRGSFSINCSVSGLSVSDCPETKHSRTASIEARARDFMIDRFLPAAKAMTLEPSHLASRKQSGELGREVKPSPTRGQAPPSQDMVIVPYTGPDIGGDESNEEEDSEYDDRSVISVKIKACGFFPWFCSKNSLQLLNPLPSMKNRSKALSSKVSNLVRSASLKSPTHKLTKYASCGNHTYKPNPSFKSCELQIPKYTSRPMFYSGELHPRPGSPYRSSRSTSPSRYRSESPNSRYQKGVGFLAMPKRVEPYDDNRSKHAQNSPRFHDLHRNTRLSSTKSSAFEKNLYMDPVNIPKVSHSILNLSKNKKCLNGSRSEVSGAYKTETGPHFVKSETFSDGTRLQIMKARGLSGPLARTSSKPSLPSYTSVSGPIPNPLTPPLPKSPSDSWLSHKLPAAVPPMNSVSDSSFNSKLQLRKQSVKIPTGAKWETIVRSSHLRYDHGRYSEELVTNAPQHPGTWK